MPNTSAANSSLAIAMSMLYGHMKFINRNSFGFTESTGTEAGIVNAQGVVSNNRHRLGKTAMQNQPDGDGTTEGQSLMILGYLYAYTATKNPVYLSEAERYWQAYFQYFYAGQRIPNAPERWVSNWLVNAKNPVLANYPRNTTEPTEGGFLGALVNFTNGVGQIPASGTTWGQYLDKATFAYVGVLGWNSIVASVYQDNGSGGPNFSVPGTKYDVDWIIAWTGEKIDSTGTVITTGHLAAEHGTVKLKNTSVNGNTKLNYITRQPVANGGYMIARNEVQHNRPLHVPVNPTGSTFNRYRMGNSSDSEQWWADACYLLWRATGNPKYKRAMDSALWTLREFAAITSGSSDPNYGVLFKNNPAEPDPFALHNSYDFTYPSGVTVTYNRNTAGYVEFSVPSKADLTWECVPTVPVGITANTYIQLDYGVTDPSEGTVVVESRFMHKLTPSSPALTYTRTLEPFNGDSPSIENPPIGTYLADLKPDGTPYILATEGRTDWYGGGSFYVTRFTDMGPNLEHGRVITCTFPDDDAGFIISFSDQPGGRAPLYEVLFRSNAEMDIRVVDNDGWRWYWILPDTAGVWTIFSFDNEDLVFSGYQPGAAGRPNPSAPNVTTVEDVTVILENGGDTWKYFDYIRFNEQPPTFSEYSGTITEFRLTFVGQNAVYGKIGDVLIHQAAAQPVTALTYTPGVIPFSNLYDVDTGAIDSTNGLPYPGYQNPVVWTHIFTDQAKFNKMVDFLHAAQAAYNTTIGQLGPVMSAYIWNIPQMLACGPANTWTMLHWGTDKAWSGYQPRAFFAGARAYQELVETSAFAIPVKLTEYLTNWLNWLWTYYNQHGIFPTDFPSAAVPAPLVNDFTGHMTGLWLAGFASLEIAGFTHPRLRRLSDAAINELSVNYRITNVGDDRQQCFWSSSFNASTPANTPVYGFWSGEIMRGISLYVMARNRNPSKDLYAVAPVEAFDEWYESRILSLNGQAGGRTIQPIQNNMITKLFSRSQGLSGDTSDKVSGVSSLSFTGSNSGVLLDYHKDFVLKRRWTIRFWIKSSTRGGFIMTLGGGSMIAWSSFQLVWQENQYINFAASSANAGYDIGSESGTEGRLNAVIPANTWTHVQVCQDGDNWYGFVGGQLVWSKNYPGKDMFDPATRGLLIGANYTDVWGTTTMTNCTASKFQHLDIYNGVCLNTSNFTPHTSPTPLK